MAFNPQENRNQHYVPVFWQRRFAGADGVLWGLENGSVRPVGADRIMSQDWLYTTFDKSWAASNVWEKVAGRREAEAGRVLASLEPAGVLGSPVDQITLRYFFAFSACRHPDVMGAGHRRTKQLAYVLADVHSKTPEQFCDSLKPFGLGVEDAAFVYSEMRKVSAERLLAEAEEIERLSPQHHALPQQMVIDTETVERVFFAMGTLAVVMIEAPASSFFILGDTPFPTNMVGGFTLPVSSTLALLWQPGGTEMFPDWTRRSATSTEIERSNCQQVDNCSQIVVGPSEAVLKRYAGTGSP